MDVLQPMAGRTTFDSWVGVGRPVLLSSLAQAPSPALPAPSGLLVTPEVVMLAGAGLALALGKWLLGREINRIDTALSDFAKRINNLEDADAAQLAAKGSLARVEELAYRLERQVTVLENAFGVIPRLEAKLDGLDGLPQRFENVAFALNQTQDLCKDAQKDVIGLRTELVRGYVGEDKYVRDMTVLTSRVDACWERIDQLSGGRMRLPMLEGRE